ncbi:MAG: glycosyltransferase [Lachnospiraceae bacterium]|nr:glycosyltransferase [Lachnospiraceae bacterium]
MRTVEVVIPVYNPDDRIYTIIKRLLKQSLKPDRINIILTVSDKFDEDDLKKGFIKNNIDDLSVTVTTIEKSAFNHGGTRQAAAEKCRAELCLFMTQDAMPLDKNLLNNLAREFDNGEIAVCYARQLPYKNAALREKFARNFNYPPEPMIKDISMLNAGKIKAIFCSDVCAMYNMEIFRELDGFERNVDFNEDMLYAHKTLTNGYLVSYCAAALIYHSHNLSLKEQFRRNREIARSQKSHPDVFDSLSSESEGIAYLVSGIKYIVKRGQIIEAFRFIADCGSRFIGYRIGKLFK